MLNLSPTCIFSPYSLSLRQEKTGRCNKQAMITIFTEREIVSSQATEIPLTFTLRWKTGGGIIKKRTKEKSSELGKKCAYGSDFPYSVFPYNEACTKDHLH